MKSTARENYLKKIFELQETQETEVISLSLLAKELGLTAGTVTGMVKKLAEADLLEYRAYVGCRLTAKGRHQAIHILRNHRIVELFLVDTIGLDWTEVHEEAERLEHAISPKVLNGIDRLLGYPKVDPHGDPIPTVDGKIAVTEYIKLPECLPGKPYEVARILDESRTFLSFIGSMSLFPGTKIRIDPIEPEAGIIKIIPESAAPVTMGLIPAGKLLAKALI